jgi:hypothetical protein
MSASCPIFGFIVEIELGDPSADIDSIARQVERDALEQRGLEWTRELTTRVIRYVVRGESSQATDDDRQAVTSQLESLRGRAGVRAFHIGPIVDFSSAA